MKRRSWQIELPHIGDLPGGTSGARKSSRACSALASVQGDTRTRSTSPERPCVARFHWSSASSTAGGWRIAIASLALTRLLKPVLVGALAHAGLALAVGLGAWFNAGMLYRKLRTHGIFEPQPGWLGFFAKLVTALAVMTAVLWALDRPVAWWLAAAWQARAGWLAVVIVAGAGAYFASLYALGIRPRDYARRVSR